MKFVLIGFLTIIVLGIVFAGGVMSARDVDFSQVPLLALAAPTTTPTLIPTLVPTAAPTAVPVQAASQAELKVADDRAAFLISRYKVPASEVAQLTKTTYAIATMIGLKQDTRTLLHQLVLDFAEHGGSQLRDFRIEGDDETVAQKIGSHAAGLRALTPGEVVRIRTNMAILGLEEWRVGKLTPATAP